ncbi:UNKNOWN [Stylonychia lemnae]|uniref:Uncharacterized protein n=1 Tax=Stylonychia lemnae TaxID=5949 RepID=A0A078AV30_STYLE|nr:UNKNOWN [Stylonychia lemnae]|eukprot:CDW86059.1 UNKNOWN [Stylonychia lemnae]
MSDTQNHFNNSQSISKINLDHSNSIASAESSMIKSWISLKDIKKMVNPSKTNHQDAIKNLSNNIKTNNSRDLPLQINSKRNLNLQMQSQKQSSGKKEASNSNKKTKLPFSNTGRSDITNKENKSEKKDKNIEGGASTRKQNLFRNTSFVKSFKNSEKVNSSINFKLKQLEIDISDQNQLIANDSMLIEDNNALINQSNQLNCLLDTYDKDLEIFQEHVEKVKQHLGVSTYTGQSSTQSRQQLSSKSLNRPRALQENLSLYHQLSSNLPYSRPTTTTGETQMSNIQTTNEATERRGESKQIFKLQNELQLLNELYYEEKQKNEELVARLKVQEFQIEDLQIEKQDIIGRLQLVENELDAQKEISMDMKEQYEEMINELKSQIRSLQIIKKKENTENFNQQNLIFSGISLDKVESVLESADFNKNSDQTVQEMGNQNVSKAHGNKHMDILKTLVKNVSYQNKSNSFIIANNKNNLETNMHPGRKGIKDSMIDQSSVNASNPLITSDCYQNSDISASLSQYENQNTKFLKHVNKSKIGSFNQNASVLGQQQKPNSKSFKLNKMMNHSSLVEGDDSQICEEADVNVQQIKTSHFNIKKVEEHLKGENYLNETGNDQKSPIEDQINSIIHQIDGYLLTQSEQKQVSSRFCGGEDSQNYNYGQYNLATFGGQQMVAQSLTGTQQLSMIWNNLKDEDREFYSKRLSVYQDENINDEEDITNMDEEQLQQWMQQKEFERQQQMLYQIEISLSKFRDNFKQ